MSQQDLAGHLAVTFQQIQKYEKGANVMAPAHLVRISKAVGKSISWLLDLPDGDTACRDLGVLLLQESNGAKIAETWLKLGDPDRQAVLSLALHLAGSR